MSAVQGSRPRFYEQQYLGSRDLDAIVDHARVGLARHALGGHVWGIAAGLELVERPSPAGGIDVFVQAGFAWDGLGRPVWVSAPAKVSPALFDRIEYDEAADGGSPAGRLVNVWIEALATRTGEPPPGFEACDAGDTASRIVEGFRISIGERPTHGDRHAPIAVADRSGDAQTVRQLADASAPEVTDESIPEQRFPGDWDTALWLVPLGAVRWLPSADPLGEGSFVEREDADLELSSGRRRYIGVVAETVNAAADRIRLRGRAAAYHPAVKQPDDLVWIEGDMRVEGDAHVLGGALELLRSDGTDDGVPLRITRRGTDLTVQIGTEHDGVNRMIVGPDVGGALEPALAVRDDSQVGIGTDAPDRPLAIQSRGDAEELVSFLAADGTTTWHLNQLFGGNSGLNFVETGVADGRLYLKAGGNVGIRTTDPTHPLHVAAAKGIRQNRLYVGGDTGWSSISYNAHHDDANNSWVFPDPARPAMTIEMDDARGGMGRFDVYSTTTANTDEWSGPHLSVAGDTGYVGIRRHDPNRPLAVRADGAAEELISFLASDGTTKWHLNQLFGGSSGLNFVETGVADGRLYLEAGGNVGIQTTNPSHPLHVAARVGIRQNALYLSGEPGWSSISYNAHRSAANNWSFPDPARVAMTIEMDERADGRGRFAVYSTRPAATQAWTGPHLSITGESGNVGVGVSDAVASLHVRGGGAGGPGDLSLHTAVIENPTNSAQADVLALKLTTPSLGDPNNFITFFNGSSHVGSIEGNGAGGVAFEGSGGDWAEWLPIAHGEDAPEPGDVVGIHGGLVSRRTEDADHVLVVSTAPSVVGNRPSDRDRERHARIALIGQTPVKVRGRVKPGDHLIATGDDGVAEARSPEKATLADHARCVGVAWEETSGRGVRKVRAAVGTRPSAAWHALAARMDELTKEPAAAKSAARSRRKT